MYKPTFVQTAIRFQTLSLSLLIFFFRPSFASELYLSQNARTFDMQQSSLIVKGLAHACLTMLNVNDSLPCNPSLLPLVKKPRLSIQGALSNGYSTLEKMRRLLDGKLTDETIDALFSEERVLQIEGNTEIDFVSNYFAARYTPINVKYFSVIRNEANPDVELSAVEEKNVILQGGYDISDVFFVGVEAKNFSRRFIKQRFQLVELATDEGKSKIKPKKQRGFLVSPMATVILPYSYKPRFAIGVANIGSISGEKEYLEDQTVIQGGAGLTFDLGWGEVDVGLDYRSLSYEETWDEKFHFGSMLRFGTMNLFGGVDYHGFSGGVFYGLEQVNAGILFTTTQTPWNSDDFFANTVYLQIGWQI